MMPRAQCLILTGPVGAYGVQHKDTSNRASPGCSRLLPSVPPTVQGLRMVPGGRRRENTTEQTGQGPCHNPAIQCCFRSGKLRARLFAGWGAVPRGSVNPCPPTSPVPLVRRQQAQHGRPWIGKPRLPLHPLHAPLHPRHGPFQFPCPRQRLSNLHCEYAHIWARKWEGVFRLHWHAFEACPRA